jgi:thioredoxin-like negative regulator of GroEL
MIKSILMIAVLLFPNISFASEQTFVNSLEDAVILSENTSMPVLLIFGADWCKNCVSLKQDITKQDIATVIDGFIICYINIDENKELTKTYQVKNIPNSRIISGGIETNPLVGYNKQNYKKWLVNRGQ